MLHNDSFFSIYFGDAREQFIPADNKVVQADLLEREPFAQIKKRMHLDNLIFLHQTHSTDGLSIISKEQADLIDPFCSDGDFLITTVEKVGLAVATADCLPIVLYDTFNKVIALVHAGWRGTIHNVVIAALDRMHDQYGTNSANLRVFFGPCAKVCCYEIGADVIEQLEAFTYGPEVILRVGGQYYLDVPLLNRLQLQEHGVKKEAFQLSYNLCTMCNPSFCSYRRNNKNSARQMTVAALK